MLRPMFVVALLALGMPLSVLVPVADALDWCTSLHVAGHTCARHVLCLHRTRAGVDEACTLGILRACLRLDAECGLRQVLP